MEPKTNIEYVKALKEASDFVKAKLGTADIAMILGSGLAGISDNFTDVKKIPFSDIPYMPQSTVKGHAGNLISAEFEKKKIIIWSGRIHRYEGYRGYAINFIAHMSAYLGCQYLLITCASGGGQKGMKPGTLMIINDYNNLTGINPLHTIMNDPRFRSKKDFDPKACFDPELIDIARGCAANLRDHPEIKAMTEVSEIQKHIFEGSYYWLTGPTYESAIECQFLTQLGMDAVGMSTVPEFLAAAAIGMKTMGIAMITDVMDRTEPLSHESVLRNAARAVPILKVLLVEIIKKLEMKPEIRESIDKCILYKEDPENKIEEYPLIQPRHLENYTLTQFKEAATFIQKQMAKLEIKEFDLCYLFLNKEKYCDVVKYYADCIKIPLSHIPNMPEYTYSSKKGALAIGKLSCSGKLCLSICGLGEEGFTTLESHFLTKVLKELGVDLVYTAIQANWIMHNEPAVLPISGYFYRGFVNSVEPDIENCEGFTERSRINSLIRKLNPSLCPDPVLFGFEGPVQPTPSELLMATTLKCRVFSTTSLNMLNIMNAEGLLPIPIAEIGMPCHEKINCLMFNKLSKECAIREAKEIVKEFVPKRNSCMAYCAFLLKELNAIKESVSEKKEISVPVDIIPEKVEQTAAELKEFFGEVPAKAIVSSMGFSVHFLKMCKLLKVAIIKSEIEAAQKMPYIYLAEYNGQKIAIVDTFLRNEDKFAECFPILFLRALVLSGVKQFFLFSEGKVVDPLLKVGDMFFVENYMPLNMINPFIGRHIPQWGERFFDVSNIFVKDHIDSVEASLGEKLPRINVLWANDSKTYIDKAEMMLGQGLRVSAVLSKGVSQSLMLHDMKKPFTFICAVEYSTLQHTCLTHEDKKPIAEKMIKALAANLKESQ